MDWNEIVEYVSPHVVRIETQNGWGTGFLAFYNHDKSWCAIATAAHVIDHAEDWQLPIRIRSQRSSAILSGTERVILIDRSTDSAVVLFFKGNFEIPEVPLGFTPMGERCGIGADVGWLGYPSIEPNTLCFFAGTVSARHDATKSYLIDGVAINGVSGGPIFHRSSPSGVQIIGCVSAYHANRTSGDALPGLLRAQDVSHFHEAANTVRNIDEANRKKAEFERNQRIAQLLMEQDAAIKSGSGMDGQP